MNKSLMTAAALILACGIAGAQGKKPLDHSVYDSWQSIPGLALTDDGKVLAYQIKPQEGDAELVLARTSGEQELRIPRGEMPALSKDSRWAVITIKAPFADTRKAKIAKKKPDQMPKDTLAYVDLQTLEIKKLGTVTRKGTALEKANNVIVYQTDWKPEVKKAPADSTAEKKKAPAKPAPVKITVLLNPATGQADTLRNVERFVFDRDAKRVAVVYKKDKKDSLSRDAVVLYQYPSLDSTVVSEGKKYYGSMSFNNEGDKLALLASMDSAKTGGKHCSIILYEEIVTGKGRKAVTSARVSELMPQGYTLPSGLGVTEHSDPRFSKNSSRLVIGVAECAPQNDTTLVDFETARLDIWSWDVYMTPPQQKLNLSRMKSATCAAVIDLAQPGRIVQIGQDVMDRVAWMDGAEGDLALVSDNLKYQVSSTWDSNSYSDVYLVDMKTGERKCLATGLNGGVQLSPAGKYVAWYDHDDLGWHTYRIADGKAVNVTAAANVPFYDEEDDHPACPPAIDTPHWLEGDKAFIMSDKYDIWKLDPNAEEAPICLTQGKGRKDNLQLKYARFRRTDTTPAHSRVGVSQPIGKKEVIWLSVFDRTTKENGFAKVSVAEPGLISCFTGKCTLQNVAQAYADDIIVYRKGDIRHPLDVYTTTDEFGSSRQWSHINPQQADYNWLDVQLVHWTAYDGTKLDGLLYTPEDLDPTKKYPMMIYFYEKNSFDLYAYRTPAPSRSIVNIPLFASRGYVVFVPDIVYKDGHPGESAYNCICSGAEAMCRQFTYIDKERMGIQGQSWGGYQTAYLVTRTDMFVAAGAGAPVGNMTSAYGGIRWGSGMVRAMQYEHGQSRIGKSLWDEGGLDLYIENSPVFHTEHVTTPVLIMHNDADGAVPWYQGIEFFMALRRFGHPAWMLEYNNEAHNLNERRNCKDLSMRLSQFFDHYMLDEPMPAWMKNGIPATRKGQYFGFEYAE